MYIFLQKKLAKQLNCEYVECSALTGNGVKQAFTKAIDIVRGELDKKQEKGCVIN